MDTKSLNVCLLVYGSLFNHDLQTAIPNSEKERGRRKAEAATARLGLKKLKYFFPWSWIMTKEFVGTIVL